MFDASLVVVWVEQVDFEPSISPILRHVATCVVSPLLNLVVDVAVADCENVKSEELMEEGKDGGRNSTRRKKKKKWKFVVDSKGSI